MIPYKKITLNIICILFVSVINAQQVITGRVLDNVNQTGFPYVNIGIEGKGVGTVSNKEGNFTLKLPENITGNDEVIFSHVGYKTQIHKVAALQKLKIIMFEPDVNTLAEVVINPRKGKIKEKKLGRKSSGLVKMLFYGFYSDYEHDVVDDALGKEVGMNFKIKDDFKINNLNFYIGTNQYKSLKFRVNIYEIENKLPGNLLFNNNILFEVKDGHTGWFEVDLTQYDLYLDKEIEDIAVTIQWVESEKMNENSKFFNLPVAKSFTKTMYRRDKAMDNWVSPKIALSFYLNTSSY